jgi:TPP-dependent pyruvate/acetoin dehydrogenase alpha subunit
LTPRAIPHKAFDDRMTHQPDPDLRERLYRSLYRIRRTEQEIARVYPTDKVKSPVHLSLGQEFVAVGVCAALRPTDIVFATYRGHAAYLAKGGDLDAMIAELYGKANGCAGGKAGSMHLIDLGAGMMGTSAIVATTIPQAVGYALAEKMRRRDTVVVSFFGDGALDEGVFHESINFAALKKLPVLFVCENNGYAIFSRVRDRVPDDNFCERAASYRVPAKRLSDGAVETLYEETSAAITAIRAGEGPQFLEVMTMRWAEHVGPGEDALLDEVGRRELAAWQEKDEVTRAAARLSPSRRAAIEREVESEIAQAFARADAAPFPQAGELETHVFHA